MGLACSAALPVQKGRVCKVACHVPEDCRQQDMQNIRVLRMQETRDIRDSRYQRLEISETQEYRILRIPNTKNRVSGKSAYDIPDTLFCRSIIRLCFFRTDKEDKACGQTDGAHDASDTHRHAESRHHPNGNKACKHLFPTHHGTVYTMVIRSA